MDRGSQLSKDNEDDEDDEDDKDDKDDKEDEEEEEATNIKSTNPHLAGGENPLQASRHLSEPQLGLAPSPSQLPCLHIVQGLSKRLLIVSQAVVQQGLIMVPGRSRSAPQLTVVGFLLQV